MSNPARKLSDSEIALARSVFGERIDYEKVRVIDGKYVPWQGKGYIIAPNGCIYWPGDCGEFSQSDESTICRFIHEMTHVMQYQHGINLVLRGFLLHAARIISFGWYDPYRVDYRPDKPFSCYNIEQQGRIAEGIFSGVYPDNIDY